MDCIGAPVQYREAATAPWWAAVIIAIGAGSQRTLKVTTHHGTNTVATDVPSIADAPAGVAWRPLPEGA